MLAFEREGVDLLVCFCGGHNPRSRRAFEKAGFVVLRTVPRPGNPKADFGYDLILTRETWAPTRHPRLRRWWTDDPRRPGRLPLGDAGTQGLAAEIVPGARLTDLGGVMSLNVRLDPPAGVDSPSRPMPGGSLVLRVHQPQVTRARLLAVQEVRRRLAGAGLRVPVPLAWRNTTALRCVDRWAELEAYVPNERPAPALESHLWLFGAMGTLHRALAAPQLRDVALPRPLDATYAPPGSLRRWLPVTEAAVRGDPEAAGIARLLRALVGRLRRRWVPAAELPVQLVHGDVRLSNVRRTPAAPEAQERPPGEASGGAPGETVYFDFGALAKRPRVHDLAFMVSALDYLSAPRRFPWDCVPRLIEAYEASAGARLTPEERRALAPYTAAVPLCHAAFDGFAEHAGGRLRSRVPFLRLSEWLLERPDAPWG